MTDKINTADELARMAAEASVKMNYWTRIALRGDGGATALRKAADWAAIVSALLARAKGGAQ